MADAARFERDLRAHGLLIDANLLVLLVVGAVNRERIAQFKRTRQYTPEDWDLLTGILEQAPRRFSIPHVLAEAGNLTDLRGPELLMARAALRQTIAILEETPVSSRRAASAEAYLRLGLTDAAIQLAARESGCAVLTDDGPLYAALSDAGTSVEKFEYLRALL